MTTKYQRPTSAYVGGNALANRDKYQSDASAQPKVSISSQKMDGDFNYIIDALNEIDEASGTASSIANRLSLSLNADGSLKASASNVLDDWVTHNVSNLNRVDASTVTMAGDMTGVYTANRRVRLIVSGVPLFAHVASAVQSASVTTIELVDITDANGNIQTIDTAPSAIAYAPIFAGASGNLNYRFESLITTGLELVSDSGLFVLNDTSVAGETYALRSNGGALEIVQNTGTQSVPVWTVRATINNTGIILASGSVGSSQLASSAVTNTKVASGAITVAKLNSASATDGQVLTADGSGGAAFEDAGGIWELISSADATGAADIDFTSGFTSGYSKWVIMGEGLTTTNSTQVRLRLSTDGGATFITTSSYDWIATDYGSINTLNRELGVNYISLSPRVPYTSGTAHLTYLEIGLTGLTNSGGRKPITYRVMDTRNANPIHYIGGGMNDTTDPINGVRITTDSGNFSGGKFYLYGIKNA